MPIESLEEAPTGREQDTREEQQQSAIEAMNSSYWKLIELGWIPIMLPPHEGREVRVFDPVAKHSEVGFCDAHGQWWEVLSGRKRRIYPILWKIKT